MRILHLYGASEDQGGVFSVLRNLAAASVPLGWRHIVWVNERFAPLRASALEYRHSRYLLDESANHVRLFWGALRAQPELFALLKAERFDVIHAHSRGGLVALLLAQPRWRRPVAFTNHNYARRRWLYRWAAHRPGMFTMVLTKAMAKYYGLPLDGDRIRVISACCSDGLFAEPLTRRRSRGTPTEPIRLTGLGSLVRWKNWHLIPAALGLLLAAERACYRIKIIGPTLDSPASRDFESELRTTIHQHGLDEQIELAGSSTEVMKELRQADWLVHPALNEPCSVAVMEALALGLPVLAGRSGGTVEIVRHGETGLLYSPNTPAALADQLRGLLTNPPRLLPPESIRDSVRARSASSVLAQYAEFYGEICRSPQGAGS